MEKDISYQRKTYFSIVNVTRKRKATTMLNRANKDIIITEGNSYVEKAAS